MLAVSAVTAGQPTHQPYIPQAETTNISTLSKQYGVSIHRIKAAIRACKIKPQSIANTSTKNDELYHIKDQDLPKLIAYLTDPTALYTLNVIAVENKSTVKRVKEIIQTHDHPTVKQGFYTYVQQQHIPQIEAQLNRPKYHNRPEPQILTQVNLDTIADAIISQKIPANGLAIVRAYSVTPYIAGKAIRLAAQRQRLQTTV